MRPGRRLGIDVGARRVGVAVCDPHGLLATPVETVSRDDDEGSDLRRISELATEFDVFELVVGLPIGLDGNEGAAAQAAREYAESLSSALAPRLVRLVDERMSTTSAHRQLHDNGRRMRSHRAVVDQVAATVILQDALDTERATGRPAGKPLEERTT